MKLFLLAFLLSLICFTTHAQELDFVIDEDLLAAWSEESLGEAETEFWPGEEANFQSQSQEEMWNVIDNEVLENDLEVRDNLDFAVEYLLDWGVSEGILDENTVYQLDTVNLIEQNQVNTTFYYFYVDLANDQGDVEKFWVGVYSPPTGGKTALDAWHIQPLLIGETGMNFLDRNWPISLTFAQFENNDYDAREAFFWGLNDVIDKAVAGGVLENNNYYVDTIYVAAVNQTPEATYFLYDAYIRPQGHPGLEVLFTVRESTNGDFEVEKYVLFPA